MSNDNLALIQILLQAGLILTLLLSGLWGLIRIVTWAKGMPKAAYLVMAIFPLLSLFPIPPPVFKNVAKAKQEQRKSKEAQGDPPE
ncbi:hypothetical protein [Pseudoalteromonas sp. OOF1S-7]|uniref:hypothetical protein n=1 Tax=Pseudoalteromonas sp. OOF1S-7 TaxID=2917757 RepID=UPI001EF70F80|nr:hypothetical protein [Pseudoalteromonas sp. OOF1S-7]MCG7535235.1 hypothetical protein [Pseudoalteromonas sp. OOF1S-7]